jgi:hypothetical protein
MNIIGMVSEMMHEKVRTAAKYRSNVKLKRKWCSKAPNANADANATKEANNMRAIYDSYNLVIPLF